MNERAGFLRGIAEAPDDDAVRLVFADWCDDHGEPDRAALVRLQCHAARRPAWCPERAWMLWRADLLLERHPEWRAELPQLEGVTWMRFERGFVAEARAADFDALRRHAHALAEVGTASSVAVAHTARDYPIAELPVLPWLWTLVFDGRRNPDSPVLNHEGVTRLAQSPMLGTLRELRLDRHWVGHKGLTALAKSPHLGKLETFSVGEDNDDGRGWSAFLASTYAANLRRLSIRGPEDGITIRPGFAERVARQFSEAANLAGLTSLDASRRGVEPVSYQLVLHSPHLASLRELVAQNQSLEPPDLIAFTDDDALPRLAALDVSDNPFARDGLSRLLYAPCLAGLERLRLAECKLTGPDGDRLARAVWRPTLTALDLSRNRLQAAGLRRLLAVEWPHLLELRLADVALKPPALDELARWPGLKRLRTLDLRGNDLPEAEARLRGAGLPDEARLILGKTS